MHTERATQPRHGKHPVPELPPEGELPLGQEVLDRFVYIAGTARGGTTVAHGLIGAHPEILRLPGPSHFAIQVHQYLEDLHGGLIKRVTRIPPWLEDAYITETLGEDVEAWLEERIRQAAHARDAATLWQTYPLTWAMLEGLHHPDEPEVACWLDKEGDATGLRDIPELFPEARVLLLARDPRSAAGSLAHVAADSQPDDGDDAGSGPDSAHLIEQTLYWRQTMQSLLRFQRRHPSQAHLIRFEDLLLDPHSVLSEVYRFVGVDPLDEDQIDELIRTVPYHKSTEKDAGGKGLRTDPVDRWKETLSSSQARLVADLTAPTARKLGYDLEGSRTRSLATVGTRVDDPKQGATLAAKLLKLNLTELLC